MYNLYKQQYPWYLLYVLFVFPHSKVFNLWLSNFFFGNDHDTTIYHPVLLQDRNDRIRQFFKCFIWMAIFIYILTDFFFDFDINKTPRDNIIYFSFSCFLCFRSIPLLPCDTMGYGVVLVFFLFFIRILRIYDRIYHVNTMRYDQISTQFFSLIRIPRGYH